MARQLRTDAEGAWHHVMNRGARQASIFYDEHDRHLFCRLLRTSTELSDVEIHGFCLMGNHYHLLVHTPSAGLGAFMQFIAQHYTQRFNRRHGFDGALFRGRYQSKLIESDAYLLATSRYIHRNPLDIRPPIDIADYPWSSLRGYLSPEAAPHWLSTGVILAMVGGPSGYRQLLAGEQQAA